MSQYGDGEYTEVYREQWRKARKPRKCHACHETITPGSRYHYTFVIFDGDTDDNVRCERCQAIFEHLSSRIRDAGDHDEYCHWELGCGDTYKERWDEEPPPEIAALAFWRPGDKLP
jgi:hypothetical protein